MYFLPTYCPIMPNCQPELADADVQLQYVISKLSIAVRNQDLDQLRLLHRTHYGQHPTILNDISIGATCSDIYCLQFLHENGYAWNEHMCSNFASSGNLKCLQYAHEHGCPWNVQTCYYARLYEHFDCLHYAYVNGCPWDGINTP
jgi:hypothetical protein